jgi:hypothetical protein
MHVTASVHTLPFRELVQMLCKASFLLAFFLVSLVWCCAASAHGVAKCGRVGVQAVASNAALYIMSHSVDMQNPVCWLEKGVSGYSLPDIEQQINPIRLCVQPCQLQFRSQTAHTKSEQDSTTNTKNNPVQYLHMKVRAFLL